MNRERVLREQGVLCEQGCVLFEHGGVLCEQGVLYEHGGVLCEQEDGSV